MLLPCTRASPSQVGESPGLSGNWKPGKKNVFIPPWTSSEAKKYLWKSWTSPTLKLLDMSVTVCAEVITETHSKHVIKMF